MKFKSDAYLSLINGRLMNFVYTTRAFYWAVTSDN